MTRVLIIGGSGMLGHKLVQRLPDWGLQVVAAIRRSAEFAARYPSVFGRARIVADVDVLEEGRLERVLAETAPQAVVNCVGIVKQRDAARDAVLCDRVNACLPHRLAGLCAKQGCRLIHISTDCVFDGTRGMYRETDPPDAKDLYGRSKQRGETTPHESAALTLRTSIVGRELEVPGHGLVEWFLSQSGKRVRGFARAVFSGLTTHELARVIARIIVDHPRLRGLYHVAGAPINKFDLLELIRRAYDLQVDIERDESQVCDRSLKMDRFHDATGYSAPAWGDIIAEMQQDATPYEDFHHNERVWPCY